MGSTSFKGALGIGVRDDRAGSDFFAGGEDDSGRDAVFHANFCDGRVGANFRARLLRGCGHGGGDALRLLRQGIDEVPAGVGSAAARMRRASALPADHGPRKCTEDSAGGDGGAKRFGVEKFGDQVRDCHRSPAQNAVEIFLAEITDGATGLQHSPEIAAGGVVDVGRRKA